jgi:hypothetical protein|tara:strand:- start:4036 stop:4644 length:609 start_codon:yes stop_codon:yes gene_type:complete
MKSNEMVNQIKTLLNIEVKLEKMKLENGTVLEAESFEKGKEIFIITDDESVALPTGEYILEDSRLLVIEEEGMIADVREVSDEVPEKEEETTEDMIEEEAAEDEMAEDKDMAEVGDWEGMEKRIQNLEDAIADLKADKVEAAKVEEEVKEELKEELSAEPAAKAIKHNPEGKESKEMKFTYSPNRIETTLDKILNKINNIKK